MSECIASECHGLLYARGWCGKHYQRWRKHGDPTVVVRGKGGRRPQSLSARFFENTEMIPFHECWEWIGPRNSLGYGITSFGKRGSHFFAHRVSWTIHYGPIPNGMLVCHHCDNPSCVRPDHLFLGTNAENTDDAIAKGRQSSHYRSKLTHVHAELVQLRKSGLKYTEIGRRYKADPSTVRKIVKRYA